MPSLGPMLFLSAEKYFLLSSYVLDASKHYMLWYRSWT